MSVGQLGKFFQAVRPAQLELHHPQVSSGHRLRLRCAHAVPRAQPRGRLRHILIEADYLVVRSAGLSYDVFAADETLRRAFVRSLEIVTILEVAT